VVARVDGTPIHEREAGIDPEAPIAFPPPDVNEGNYERLRRESVEPLVRTEIENVVLHREALRRGLDSDPEYQQRAGRIRGDHARRREEVLVSVMERELRRGLVEQAAVSAREVEEYLETTKRNPDPFGHTRHLTPASVEEMLRRDKGVAAFRQRLRSMALESGLEVDGSLVPFERLEVALRHHFTSIPGSARPGPFSETSLFRLLVDAVTRREGVDDSQLLGDVELFAAAFRKTVLSIRGRRLPLGRTACTRFFEPQPTQDEVGVRQVDPHGLSLCLFRAIRTALLVQEARRTGLSLPDEELAAWRLAGLERQALIRVLLREEGVLDVPQEIPTRRRQLVARLLAKAEIELLL